MSRIYVCRSRETAFMFKDFTEACDCGASLALVNKGGVSEADRKMILNECSKRSIKKMRVEELGKIKGIKFNRRLGEVDEYVKR